MTKYKVALFDLDNTLLKTEDASVAALTYALNQDGVEVTPQAIVELMLSLIHISEPTRRS